MRSVLYCHPKTFYVAIRECWLLCESRTGPAPKLCIAFILSGFAINNWTKYFLIFRKSEVKFKYVNLFLQTHNHVDRNLTEYVSNHHLLILYRNNFLHFLIQSSNKQVT